MRSTSLRRRQPTLRRAGARSGNRPPSQLQWYLNRLRCMSPAEVVHRLRRAIAARAEQAGLVAPPAGGTPDLGVRPRPWVDAAAHVDIAAHLDAADRILSGEIAVFALPGTGLAVDTRWNRDPKTGREAPLTFGKLLDYRDGRRVGDIKYLWELNRHLHLVTLAQGYALSGDPRYAHALRGQLESWFAACPYGLGPNWTSALEVSLRLLNWSVAWQLAGGADSPMFANGRGDSFRREWLEAVFRHAEFVRGYFSLHSSANNHLIGEAAGLFVAALTWPHWREAGAWSATAKAILEREVVLQVGPDGVNREQSVGYQQFTLELLLLPLLAGRANGHPLSDAYRGRIESMLEYLASIMDVAGHLPAIGDADDAVAVRFDPHRDCSSARSLLATGALLFGRGDFKAKSGGLDDRTRWLFGAAADAAYHSIPATPAALPVHRAFRWGGYWVLGCDFETDNEIRLVVDAGPLGYQAIAAHGHADALAFTLSVGGLEFLVDPGTYAYHTNSPWRQHFRGTGAHNTLRVDGADQSEPGGNFLWLRKANATCDLYESSPDVDRFEGRHDGYARLPDPVWHIRRIELDKRTRRIVVVDRVQTEGEHELELTFQCSEACVVAESDGGYQIRQDGRIVFLRLPDLAGSSAQVRVGCEAPIGGWVSRRFDRKEPAPTVVWRARVAGSCTLRSEIDCDEMVRVRPGPERRRSAGPPL